MRGTNAEYRLIRNMTIASAGGSARTTCPSGTASPSSAPPPRSELFSGIPPENEEISVGGTRFTVVGVLEPKGQLAQYTR